jgi:hypothetical protein
MRTCVHVLLARYVGAPVNGAVGSRPRIAFVALARCFVALVEVHLAFTIARTLSIGAVLVFAGVAWGADLLDVVTLGMRHVAECVTVLLRHTACLCICTCPTPYKREGTLNPRSLHSVRLVYVGFLAVLTQVGVPVV